MRKIKLKKFSSKTLEIYQYFKNQPGSGHIAKPTTIEVILDICEKKKPKRILEMGGGLGTISYILLKYSDAFVDIYEDNSFCLSKLQEQIAPFQGRFNILKNYHQLPESKVYDLVIVDGGSGKGQGKNFDGGYPGSVTDILNHLEVVKIIYVEGYRYIQCSLIFKVLMKRYIYKLIRYDKTEFKGEELSGGLKISCTPSKSKILRILIFYLWSVIEWYPVRNKLSYLWGKLFNK